jgi:hypothetical protein
MIFGQQVHRGGLHSHRQSRIAQSPLPAIGQLRLLVGIQGEMDSGGQFGMLASHDLFGAMEATGERLDGAEQMSDLFQR